MVSHNHNYGRYVNVAISSICSSHSTFNGHWTSPRMFCMLHIAYSNSYTAFIQIVHSHSLTQNSWKVSSSSLPLSSSLIFFVAVFFYYIFGKFYFWGSRSMWWSERPGSRLRPPNMTGKASDFILQTVWEVRGLFIGSFFLHSLQYRSFLSVLLSQIR
jgi:hypothetical protein